jgi:hypothetical protein
LLYCVADARVGKLDRSPIMGKTYEPLDEKSYGAPSVP